MTFGTNTYTDSGNLLYSTDYPCYHEITGITFSRNYTIVVNAGALAVTEYYIPYIGNYTPLVFVALAVGDDAAIINLYQQGSNWFFSVVGSVRQQPQKLKVYGSLQNNLVSGNGIVVRGNASEINFNSSANPVWIKDSFSFGPVTITSALNWSQISGTLTQTYTLPIFTSSMLGRYNNPFTSSITIMGIKRHTLNYWSTYPIFTGSSLTAASIGGYTMLVADYV
jgi:hypothetical protein